MGQTKRKRRTKHRGNAAGIIETRGRTGRPPSASERRTTRTGRPNRFDSPPNWRSAFNRAIVAVIIFVVAIVLLFKQPLVQAVALGSFMLLIYTPMGYYTDLLVYRKRQAKKLQAARKDD